MKKSELENRGVYSWWTKYIWQVSDNIRRIQGENYALELDANGARISKYKYLTPTAEFKEYDFASAEELFCNCYIKRGTDLFYGEEAKQPYRGTTKLRVLEMGKEAHRIDMPHIEIDGEELPLRLECLALKKRFIVSLFIYPTVDGERILGLEFNAKSRKGVTIIDKKTAVVEFEGSKLLLEVEGGRALFLDGVLRLEKTLKLKSGEESRIAVKAYPYIGETEDVINYYRAVEKLKVSAYMHEPKQETLKVNYVKEEGIYYVDLNGGVHYKFQDFLIEENRNARDRVEISVENPTEIDVEIPLSFRRDGGSISIYGFTPTLRNATTGEPMSEGVQISKNWHSTIYIENFYNTKFHPELTYGGEWYHGYATVPVGENGRFEYCCNYAEVNGISSVSHSQLCLVGWGGNSPWDQIAIGSYGENVTFSNEMGHTFVNDVRPIFVKNKVVGSDYEYDWGGNVGGCQFLTYPYRTVWTAIRQKTDYKTQGFNMADVAYESFSEDGNFKVNYSVRIGRTNDVSRFYYTMRYELLKDTDLSDISFFSMNSWRYKQDSYLKYAWGDGEEVLGDERTPEDKSVADGKVVNEVTVTPGKAWFMLYDSTAEEENANVCFCLREYRENINGEAGNRANIKMRVYSPNVDYGQQNVFDQVGFEVCSPHSGVAKAGSVVKLVVEHTVLPANKEDFYGKADYLNSTADYFNTPLQAIQQSKGNSICVKAITGEVENVYPPIICCKADRAEIILEGGLGYTPMVFKNLSSLGGYALQIKKDGVWVDLPEYKNGYFVQGYELEGKYALVYNVKNTEGLSFGKANSYRLIRR